MKRAGYLISQIAEPDNLRLAFWKAAKGKRAQSDCRRFQENLEANLAQLREDLLEGQAKAGDYHYFRIFDPKERTICAASFRERVMHHALMNICEPILERAAVFDSYACRKGKGRLVAIHRAQSFSRRHGWFLKLDVRKYFDSVDQGVLYHLLERKFKDDRLLDVLHQIIASYHTLLDKGLPIGNLTSQHFANFYLAPLDRFIKEGLSRGAYVRYMDDFVIWGDSSRELRALCEKIREFLSSTLKLELNSRMSLNKTGFGMDFLGVRIFPGCIRLARRSKARFGRKFRKYEQAYLGGQWTELQLQQRTTALAAFVRQADSRNYRLHVMDRFGVVATGLEPRAPRGQLEQQRQELPLGEPQ